MGYYIRILSPSEKVPSFAKLQSALADEQLTADLTKDDGDGDEDWTELTLGHQGGPEIASIERNASDESDLVAGEIDEFLESIADCKPTTAAQWLADYLPTVKTIYAFQLLFGTDVKNGWDILGAIKNSIHNQIGGVLQADSEGFTNEEGYHILWQFSKSVQGTWWMGTLQDGKWIHYEMDLGNRDQQRAFERGEIPKGVTFTK